MERFTLHKFTAAYDYKRNHLSKEEVAQAYDRLAELEDKLESGQLRENNESGCEMCKDGIFDAYVPVSFEGDIIEKPAGPGEEWVYHANYCPNCGRRLISKEAEARLKEFKEQKNGQKERN